MMRSKKIRTLAAILTASAMISGSLCLPVSAQTLGSNDTLVSGEDADGLYIEAANAVKVEDETYYFEKEYDGEPLLPEITVPIEGATLLYGLNIGVYGPDKCPEYSSAGEYTVYARVAADGYETKLYTFVLTINKAKNEWITEPDIGNRYINKPFAKPRGEAKFGEVEYTYGDSPDGPFEEARPTAAGVHYMRAAVAETSDYEGISSVVRFQVNLHPIVTYPTWYIYDYTGKPQSVEPLDFGEGCTVRYGLEEDKYDLTEPPAFTEVGRHKVYFEVNNGKDIWFSHYYDVDITEPGSFNVNDAMEYCTAVEYDGKSHTFYDPPHDTLGDYTIVYGLDNDDPDTMNLDEPPSYTEPGIYLVAFRIDYSDKTITGYSILMIVDNRPWTGGMLGDIDRDENVTSADALAALRISAGLEKSDEFSLALGDIDGDESVTSNDALQILRYSAGLYASEAIGSEV